MELIIERYLREDGDIRRMPDLLVTDCGSMGKGAASPQSVTVRVVLLLSKDVFSAAASSLDHTVWYLTMILRICELSSLERMLPPFISHTITESSWDGVRESLLRVNGPFESVRLFIVLLSDISIS